jgi:hypothetical protein
MSYPAFAFSGPTGTSCGSDVLVAGIVTNTGALTRPALAQVYVSRGTPRGGDPDDLGPRLAAFEQIHREPGESRPLELRREPRPFARWDVVAGGIPRRGRQRHQVRVAPTYKPSDQPPGTIRRTSRSTTTLRGNTT